MVTRKIQPVIVAVTTKTASKTIGKEAGGKVTSKAVSKAAVKVAGKPAPEPVTVSINNAVKIAPDMLKNIFAAMPAVASQEAFDDLLDVPGLRIERIVSHGQKSPPDFWYEQDEDEWVIILLGSAGLQIEGQDSPIVLTPGDHYWIPAGLRHRVDWTAQDGPTIWLAVYRA